MRVGARKQGQEEQGERAMQRHYAPVQIPHKGRGERRDNLEHNCQQSQSQSSGAQGRMTQ